MAHYTSIICESKADMEEQFEYAKKQAAELLEEFKLYYSGDIGINVYPKRHNAGWSVCADLTVNGKLCRHYDPADMCFLDLNTLILKRLIEARVTQDYRNTVEA